MPLTQEEKQIEEIIEKIGHMTEPDDEMYDSAWPVYLRNSINSLLQKREDELVERIEDYSEGLLVCLNPQATKEEIIKLIKNKG